MEMIDVDGVRIAYELAGDGPPLVLLHGYVADGPTTWRRQIEALADEFTVVTWNAPGVGGSSDPPEAFGMAGYADCLAGLVDVLRLDKPDVAGLSFGGALALELHRRHPAIPRTLILVSAYAGWGGSLPADIAEQRLRQALALADLSPDEFIGALLPTMFSDGTPPRQSLSSVRVCGRSIRSGSEQWPARPPKTSAKFCPTSTSRRCWSTATTTCGRHWRLLRTSTPRFPARRLSSWPTPVISAISKPPKRSTTQSEFPPQHARLTTPLRAPPAHTGHRILRLDERPSNATR